MNETEIREVKPHAQDHRAWEQHSSDQGRDAIISWIDPRHIMGTQ